MEKEGKRKSVRRHKFEQGIRAGKSARRAALDAGYSPSTAKNRAAGMAAPVVAGMAAALRRHGVTEDLLADRLRRLLDSKDETIQLRTAQECVHIHDGYPAPKEKVEDSRPITIVLPGNLRELMPAQGEK